MLFGGKYEYIINDEIPGMPFNVTRFTFRITLEENYKKNIKLIHAIALSNYPLHICVHAFDDFGIFISTDKFYGRLNLDQFEFSETQIKIKENSYLMKQLKK